MGSRTVGYVLSDNDVGDFYSIDVLRDTAYNVPTFRLVSGTTSCPYHEGTQRRDDPIIGVFPPIVTDVPVGSQAKFTLTLANNSQSDEAREYAVRVITSSNPDGA